MRTALAHDVAAIARLGGDGGLVAVDRRGNIAMPFNSEAMLRGCIGRDGRPRVWRA